MKFAELTTSETHGSKLWVIVDSHEEQLVEEAETRGVLAQPVYLDEFDMDEVSLRWPRDSREIMNRARSIGRGYFVA